MLDVGEADPAWLGPATLVSLVLLSGLVVIMLRVDGHGDASSHGRPDERKHL